MKALTIHEQLPVAEPFRLDLTADALRRLASNAVDVVTGDGAYARVLRVRGEAVIVRVRQLEPARLDVQASGRDAAAVKNAVRRLLGTDVNLSDWYARAAEIPWLAPFARRFRGVKPPRYAGLWEACTHAIVFQQISLHAASAIMARLVEALGEPFEIAGARVVAFPEAQAFLAADGERLRALGLSVNKLAHLRAVAAAVAGGEIDEAEIEALPTPEAAARLVCLRGIGPWSAAVVLLRGFGRLDTFPLRDSGVARSVRLMAGDAPVDLDGVLERLGPARGMLYYHLLLGRIRNLVPGAED